METNKELLYALELLHKAVCDAHVLDVKKRYSLCVASSIASKAIHNAKQAAD
jgi:hypothetical protein